MFVVWTNITIFFNRWYDDAKYNDKVHCIFIDTTISLKKFDFASHVAFKRRKLSFNAFNQMR